jgi:hypothetical protein
MSFQTVEDMQERLRNMCDEIDCLKYDLEKAASDERAKIVAWLRGFRWFSTAAAIEAGEHLK